MFFFSFTAFAAKKMEAAVQKVAAKKATAPLAAAKKKVAQLAAGNKTAF